jgi:hypothetical protein
MFDDIYLCQIKADEKNVHSFNESYLVSYPVFVNYFRHIPTITKSNLIIGIHFTYGWMPTAFDFRSNDFNKAISILNKAKTNEQLTCEELSVLKCLFNNSLVGTSKLLHFINPHAYAIWDSHVYHYLTNETPHTYRIENLETYQEYLKFCQRIINYRGYEEIHRSMKRKIKKTLTKLRSLELILYING